MADSGAEDGTKGGADNEDGAALADDDDDDDVNVEEGVTGGVHPGGAIMSIHSVVKSDDAPMRSVFRTDHKSAATTSAGSAGNNDGAVEADADADEENEANAVDAREDEAAAVLGPVVSASGCRRKCSGRIAKYALSRSQCTRRRHRANRSAIGKWNKHSDRYATVSHRCHRA
jgi:hypothetical protein